MAEYSRPDYWTLRAKKEGYPARSVYKLEEIIRKFGLLRIIFGERSVREGGVGEGCVRESAVREGASTILDVGAAPGSWSLWLLRQMKGRGKLVAVDIQDLSIMPQAATARNSEPILASKVAGAAEATGAANSSASGEPNRAHFVFVKGAFWTNR